MVKLGPSPFHYITICWNNRGLLILSPADWGVDDGKRDGGQEGFVAGVVLGVDHSEAGLSSGAVVNIIFTLTIFDGVRLADDNYAELVEDDLMIDANVDERHLNTGQDEIEAPRAKNPGKC